MQESLAKGWILLLIGAIPITDIDAILNIILHISQVAALIPGAYWTWVAYKKSRSNENQP